MTARTLLPTLVALVVGIALGWFLSSRVTTAPIPGSRSGGVEQEGLASLKTSLEEIRSILRDQEIEASVRSGVRTEEVDESSLQLAQSPDRVPVGPTPGLPALDAQVETLREQVEAMGSLLEALRKSLAEGSMPAILPSLELLNRWPAEQNWSQLQQVIESRDDYEGLMNRLRWMSQDDVLRTYGRPTWISESGLWTYDRPGAKGRPASVQFTFTQDYVMQVRVY